MVKTYEQLCIDTEELLLCAASRLCQAHEHSQKFSFELANKIDMMGKQVIELSSIVKMMRYFAQQIENDK